MSPYRAMFGVEAFELDHELGLQNRIDEDPGTGEELARNLANLHSQLIGQGMKSRDRAEKSYNKTIKEVAYQEGQRVLVYNPQADLEKGRKLSSPWIGPYRIEKKLSDISCILKSEVGNKTARSHVNRLRHFNEQHIETGNPIGGVFPDSRRILKSIIEVQSRSDGRYFKVRSAGRTGTKWVRENMLPEVVVKSFDNIEKKLAL
eukprot:IDg23167t1